MDTRGTQARQGGRVNEEIMFQMGLGIENFERNKDRAASGIKQLKTTAQDAGSAIKESFKGAFEAFSFGLLAEAGKKVLEFGERVERSAEIAGVSADFFQSAGAAMRQTGGDAEKGAKGLERLTGMIGQAVEGNTEAQKKFSDLGISIADAGGKAKSTETLWREIADRVHNATDANQAAAIAVGLFGNKLGLELVPALRAGSKGIDDFGKAASKLSDSDLKTIKEMNQTLEQSGNTAMVWAGKTIGAFANVFKAAGNFSVTGYFKPLGGETSAKPEATAGAQIKQSHELIQAYRDLRRVNDDRSGNDGAKLLGLMEQERDIIDDLKDDSLSELERVKLQTELARKHNEVLGKRAEMQAAFHKKEEEADKKKHEQEDLFKRRNDEIRNAKEKEGKEGDKLAVAKGERSQLSLEDLRNSQFRFGGQLGEDQRTAWSIKRLESQGEWNRQHGFLDDSKARFDAADELRKTLSGNVTEKDRIPFKSLEESSKDATQHLADLLALATGDGIPIDPKMGP